MTPIAFCPVADVNFETFTHTFNMAYSDYFVPISMTPSAFRHLIVREDLDLAASVVAVNGVEMVGTGLLGIRGQRGWIGGMGVIPTRRRQGIGRQMMCYLLDRVRERALEQVNLEVIEANTGARALYQKLGFTHRRYLLILEREPGFLPAMPPGYNIQQREPDDLLAYFTAFHDTSPNCWQRGLRSLQGLAAHANGWAVLQNGNLQGYALGWADQYGIRLVDLAVDPTGDRVALAQALLVHLHQQHPEASGSIYNLAEDDPVASAFTVTGYTVSFRQHEMTLSLP